jgi:hypothetical protein
MPLYRFHYLNYRYQGKHIDELDLVPGDILLPMFMLEAGWWVGKLVFPVDKSRLGQVGAFPANYVLCFVDK